MGTHVVEKEYGEELYEAVEHHVLEGANRSAKRTSTLSKTGKQGDEYKTPIYHGPLGQRADA